MANDMSGIVVVAGHQTKSRGKTSKNIILKADVAYLQFYAKKFFFKSANFFVYRGNFMRGMD
jgi:hypothetical protein